MRKLVRLPIVILILCVLGGAVFAGTDTLTVPHLDIASAERAYVEALPVLHVAVDDNFTPFSRYSVEDKKYIGASVEIFETIAQMTGLKYKYDLINNTIWANKMQSFKDNKIQILFPVSHSEDRERHGNFTNPFYKTYYCIIGKYEDEKSFKNIHGFSGQTIGVAKDTGIIEFLQSIENIKLKYYDSDELLYRDVINNKIKYICQNENVFLENYYTKELFQLKKKYRIVESPKYYSFYISNAKEMQPLIKIFNMALSKIDSQSIIASYSIGEAELLQRYMRNKNEHYQITLVLLLAIIVVVLLAYFYIKSHSRSLLYKKQSEINKMALLQAQIKPHFIYNTLNTIVGLCYSEPKKAGELTANFSKYLRIVFDSENYSDWVLLERELELVKLSLYIEKMRFGDRVNYNIDVKEEDCKDCSVMLLVIQPVVENALKHGILKKRDGGNVDIRISRESGCLKVMVADNGVGMSRESLKQVMSMHREGKNGGLQNIQDRLRKYRDFKFSIISEPNHGTHVFMEIPIRVGKQ